MSRSSTFQLLLSTRFLCLSSLTAVAFSFFVGRLCRHILLLDVESSSSSLLLHLSQLQQLSSSSRMMTSNEQQQKSAVGQPQQRGRERGMLPQPILPHDKIVPHSVYTSKQFDTGIASKSDSILAQRSIPSVMQQQQNGGNGDVQVAADGTIFTTTDKHPTDFAESDPDYLEELHEPAGQHLLVDIENIDANFLNSETRLARAMMTLIEMSGLTLLSYHCHALIPMGVSCVGVLLESHVSFHTWPIPGVITLDLFTCGNNPLEPLLPDIEQLFAVPRPGQAGIDEPPHTQWAFKNRGFQKADDGTVENQEAVESSHFLMGVMDFELKDHVASVETPFQTVDIWDVINPRFRKLDDYKKSLTNDGSYQAQHPELFRPNRVVYLDNVKQSSYYGDAAYHESLVHPALFAHEHPKRVAIIGGGEGATLREVLKHKTVEKVVMIEIDELMVNTSRQYLPEWSDCSHLEGSLSETGSCFDDPRSEVLFTDAVKWFTDRYAKSKKDSKADKFDVIIMDALDPASVVEFSDVLYANDEFAGSLYNALSDDGVLVSQVGEASWPNSAAKQYTSKHAEDIFVNHLIEEGFEAVKNYEDAHGGFDSIWEYMIAMKDADSKENWFFNQAQISLELKKRIFPTKTGENSLRYFDGATQMVFRHPSRVVENVFCRRIPTPVYCEKGHAFDPELENIPISALQVKGSTIPGAGRGLFFTKDYKKGSYLAIDAGVHDLFAYPSTRRTIKKMLKSSSTKSLFKVFDIYLFGYGWATDYFGDAGYSVDTSVLTFINHGCNRTNVVGPSYSITELDAPDSMPEEMSESSPVETEIYSPYFHRNHMIYINALDNLNRDVQAGEEVLDNYLGYLHEDNWLWGIRNYRSQCLKQGGGVVTDYETEKTTSKDKTSTDTSSSTDAEF